MSDFHGKTIAATLHELKSAVSGLTEAEAAARLKHVGPNVIPAAAALTPLAVLVGQFRNPLIYILLIAGAVALAIGERINAGVIGGAVLLNTVIGFLQEYKASQALAQLKRLVEFTALVRRDGRERTRPSRELVPGDIVILQEGVKVPADARLIEAKNLTANEAPLTGESIPSAKQTDPVALGVPLPDRENMVYAGTIIARGLGRAVVTATGAGTELGKIARLVGETAEEKTPLMIRLERFSRSLGSVLLVVCAVIILIGVWQERPIADMLIIGVALAVAAVPEGLGMAVTVSLAVGMRRLIRRGALVRRLVAAETLGSTTVIATDKTGTLTEGRMRLAVAYVGGEEIALGGRSLDDAALRRLRPVLSAALLANDATIENPDAPPADWRITGDTTDAALVLAAYRYGVTRETSGAALPKLDELPFSSESRFMATLHRDGHGAVLFEKGALESVLPKAAAAIDGSGEAVRLTPALRASFQRMQLALAGRGYRVVAVATRRFRNAPDAASSDWAAWDAELTVIGLLALADPLRPDARRTIEACSRAGLRPVIITGDHPLTTRAIARELGMDAGADRLLTGEQLDRIPDAEFIKLVGRISIYARVSPHHKLRIVRALQARGEVVAMTGDGVNDAPALKAADIGIALGMGTDIAKETADIVLTDDNFATIVETVRQGRVIFENIKKTVAFLLSDSFSEMVLIVGAILLSPFSPGLPLPLLPAQILWNNIVKDALPHFALAFERGSTGALGSRPTERDAPILSPVVRTIIFGFGLVRDSIILLVFWWLYRAGYETAFLRTTVFAMLGTGSLMYVFSLRSLQEPLWRLKPADNPLLLGAAAVSFGFLLLGIYWPPLQPILSTVPLPLSVWWLVAAVGLTSVAVIEAIKLRYRRT